MFGESIRHHLRACSIQMSMQATVKTLVTTPEAVLHKHLCKTWMDVAKALGITLEPVVHKHLWTTQMDAAKKLVVTLEPALHTELWTRHRWTRQKH